MQKLSQVSKNLLVVGVLMISLLIFGGGSPYASAQTTTISDLQAQISQLLNQISQLQSQLQTMNSGGSVVNVCPYVWTRNLSIGSSGPDVQRLQQWLNTDV